MCWPSTVVVVLAAIVVYVAFVLGVSGMCVCCVMCGSECDGVAVGCVAKRALVLLASVRPLFPRCVLCIVIAAWINCSSACRPVVYSLVTSRAEFCGDRVVRLALLVRWSMYVESSIGDTVWLRCGVYCSVSMFVVVWWCGPNLLKVLTRKGCWITVCVSGRVPEGKCVCSV